MPPPATTSSPSSAGQATSTPAVDLAEGLVGAAGAGQRRRAPGRRATRATWRSGGSRAAVRSPSGREVLGQGARRPPRAASPGAWPRKRRSGRRRGRRRSRVGAGVAPPALLPAPMAAAASSAAPTVARLRTSHAVEGQPGRRTARASTASRRSAARRVRGHRPLQPAPTWSWRARSLDATPWLGSPSSGRPACTTSSTRGSSSGAHRAGARRPVLAPADGLDDPGGEHHALEQRVRRQPVGAVHARARDLARGPESGQRRGAVEVGDARRPTGSAPPGRSAASRWRGRGRRRPARRRWWGTGRRSARGRWRRATVVDALVEHAGGDGPGHHVAGQQLVDEALAARRRAAARRGRAAPRTAAAAASPGGAARSGGTA